MKNRNGFTLIELTAVISVIAILFIFVAPVTLHLLSGSRGIIKKYERESLMDAAKNYLVDIDEGIKTLTYNLDTETTVNNKTYSKGMNMAKYDAKTFIIENDGIIITVGDLVKEGYFERDCKYAGTTVEYNDDGVTKTSVVAKDTFCSAPKNCQIKLQIKAKKVENNHYYVSEDYLVELLDGC